MERHALVTAADKKNRVFDKFGKALDSAIPKGMLFLSGLVGFLRFDDIMNAIQSYKDEGGESSSVVLVMAVGVLAVAIGMFWMINTIPDGFKAVARNVTKRAPQLKIPMFLFTFIPYLAMLYWCYLQGWLEGVEIKELSLMLGIAIVFGLLLRFSPIGRSLREKLEALDKKGKTNEVPILAEGGEAEEADWWEEKEKRWDRGVLFSEQLRS